MSNKAIAIFIGAAAIILVVLRANTSAAGTPAAAPSADASIGANPLGAATGTTDANGDPLGGLGSTGGG
jgi:hypothetical protein